MRHDLQERCPAAGRYDRIVRHDRGVREAEIHHRGPVRPALADRLVPWCARCGTSSPDVPADPERHPRHAPVPDGRLLLRPQALHAASPCFPPCASAAASHITVKGGTLPRGPGQGRHHRLRQDRHPDPRYPQGGQGRSLLRLQRRAKFCSWPPASRSTFPTRWPTPSSGRPKSAASSHEEYALRGSSISWPTASPAASAVSGSSSAATTSSLRTSTAPSPRDEREKFDDA